MGSKYIKLILYGFLTWLIPFVASFLFYTREGELLVDIFLFKSVMIVVGSVSAAALLISYFKKITEEYLKEGAILGFSWFAINILFDLIVLVQIWGMSFGDYFTDIGLRYLVIPVMCIMIGKVLEDKKCLFSASVH